jgi:hypothetical protein
VSTRRFNFPSLSKAANQEKRRRTAGGEKGGSEMKKVEVKEVFDDLRKGLKSCTEEDISELLRLRDELHDLLIEHVAFLRKHRMKIKLTKTWTNLISET